MKGITLRSINDVLTKIGLVLVVGIGEGTLTRFWIERWKTYCSRTEAVAE